MAPNPKELPAKHHIYRDALTGQICTEEYAKANPATTVRETIEREPKEDVRDERMEELLGE